MLLTLFKLLSNRFPRSKVHVYRLLCKSIEQFSMAQETNVSMRFGPPCTYISTTPEQGIDARRSLALFLSGSVRRSLTASYTDAVNCLICPLRPPLRSRKVCSNVATSEKRRKIDGLGNYNVHKGHFNVRSTLSSAEVLIVEASFISCIWFSTDNFLTKKIEKCVWHHCVSFGQTIRTLYSATLKDH